MDSLFTVRCESKVHYTATHAPKKIPPVMAAMDATKGIPMC